MSSDHSGADFGVTDETDRPEVVLVAALDAHRAIGHEGDLPWRLPADLRHFRETTMGHPIAMGRRTHEAIGTVLEGRENIVVTTREDYRAEGCTVAHSIEEALEHAEKTGAECVMFIGGESVFRQVLPVADRMELTVVHGKYPGDTYFPGFETSEWEVTDASFRSQDGDNEAPMTFVTLRAIGDVPRSVCGGGAGPLPDVLRKCLEE